MKRSISYFLASVLVAMIFSSCSSKQDPINELEELAFELKENSEDYSQSDWEKIAVKYSEIEDQLQQYEYTDEELKQIGKLKAQCVRAIVHSSANNLKDLMHSFQMQLEGASEEMEGAMDELGEIFDDVFSDSEE